MNDLSMADPIDASATLPAPPQQPFGQPIAALAAARPTGTMPSRPDIPPTDQHSIHRPAATPHDMLLATVQMTGLDDQVEVVVPDGRQLRVAIAVGCLIQPDVGDLVQIVTDGSSGWITMVLRREAASPTAVLSAGQFALEVRAPHLALTAAERLSLQAERIEQRAAMIETVAQERASAVLGSDTLQAGQANWTVERHLGMHCRTQLMTAEGLMKINGGQIHMA